MSDAKLKSAITEALKTTNIDLLEGFMDDIDALRILVKKHDVCEFVVLFNLSS